MRLFLMLISLGAILSGCREHVLSGLSEREANNLIAGLDEHKIEARKESHTDGTWKVLVDGRDVVRSYRYIEESRILQPDTLAPARSSRLVASREEERFLQERQTSRELERTILSLPGIRAARVHLAAAQTGPVFGATIKPAEGSGSVLIVTEQEHPSRHEELQALVGGATGIPKDRISVVSIVQPFSQHLTRDREEYGPQAISEKGLLQSRWMVGGVFALAGVTTLLWHLYSSRWRSA